MSAITAHVAPTLEKIAPQGTRSGLTAMMTSVSFQPYTKPIRKPVKKVENHWKKFASLSPMPSWILFTSLCQHEINATRLILE